MGYLVSFAAIKGLQNTTSLHQINKSIPWRAYRLSGTELTLIEWLHRPNPNNPPPNIVKFPSTPCFCRRPSGISFSDEFGERVPGLDRLYDDLLKLKRASTLPKVGVHTGLLLNELTSSDVLVIMSDDDGWDFGCEVSKGRVVKLCFDGGDNEIIELNSDGKPLITKSKRQNKLIHEVACTMSCAWSQQLENLFGFDGDVAALKLVELDRTQQLDPKFSSVSLTTKPFWKFW